MNEPVSLTSLSPPDTDAAPDSPIPDANGVKKQRSVIRRGGSQKSHLVAPGSGTCPLSIFGVDRVVFSFLISLCGVDIWSIRACRFLPCSVFSRNRRALATNEVSPVQRARHEYDVLRDGQGGEISSFLADAWGSCVYPFEVSCRLNLDLKPERRLRKLRAPPWSDSHPAPLTCPSQNWLFCSAPVGPTKS